MDNNRGKQAIFVNSSLKYIWPCFSTLAWSVLLSGLIIALAFAEPITVESIGHNGQPARITNTHLPYANPDAPKGGTLSQSAMGNFNSANPWMTTGNAMVGTDYLYDTLVSSALDGSFMSYPQLADRITYDPKDTSWVIYHVNSQAKFWDGSAVTSHDVKATFDALLTKGLVQIRSYLGAIDRIETLDNNRVKFYFKSADNKDMLLTVGQFPVFAKVSIDEQFGKLSLTPLMGSGPYQLKNIDAGRSVTYQRNPNYWGQHLLVNKGRFNFNIIKYIYYGSDNVAFEGFKVGQYQFRQENKARRWVTAYDFVAAKQGFVKQEKIVNKNPVSMQAVVMNLRQDIFKDIRIRQAVTEAFDFELLNRTLFYGQNERLQSFFHGSELAATGTPSLHEMRILKPLLTQLHPIQKQATIEAWQLPKSDGQGYHRAALLRARKLLLEAGFYYQNMMLYQANGRLAKVEVLMTDDKLSRELLPYIRNLNRLGFSASLRLVDQPQYLERLRRFDYDMVISSFMQGSSPGAEQAYLWGSKAANEVGNRNYSGIENKSIDTVIDGLTRAESHDDIVAHSKVLDRLLRAGYYMVPMYGKTSTNVAYWDKYRHVNKLPDFAMGIDYWWVDTTAEHNINKRLNK